MDCIGIRQHAPRAFCLLKPGEEKKPKEDKLPSHVRSKKCPNCNATLSSYKKVLCKTCLGKILAEESSAMFKGLIDTMEEMAATFQSFRASIKEWGKGQEDQDPSGGASCSAASSLREVWGEASSRVSEPFSDFKKKGGR